MSETESYRDHTTTHRDKLFVHLDQLVDLLGMAGRFQSLEVDYEAGYIIVVSEAVTAGRNTQPVVRGGHVDARMFGHDRLP